MYTINSVVTFVTERFIYSEEGSTVKDIAEGMRTSQANVRKLLGEAHGCPDGLTVDTESRPSYSRNYPGQQTGEHRVDVFYPTKSKLVAVIREHRTLLSAF